MMMKRIDYRIPAALAVATLIAAGAFLGPQASSSPQQASCIAPADLMRFNQPLNRVTQQLTNNRPIAIVAMGSSSTAGAGASSTAANYPSRLRIELQQRFPQSNFKIINRGVGGTEMADMLAKFDANAAEDKPDLVLWQLGTNSLLRDRALANTSDRIKAGVSRIKASGADVILINPQYAPKVIAKPEVEHMVKIIAKAASQNNINLFDRYAVMRHWRLAQNIPFGEFLSVDELHMNDWSYGCVAKLLAAAIKDTTTRPAIAASNAPAR